MNGNGHQKQRMPVFTSDELKAIHRELFTAPWKTEAFYEEREAVIRKLNTYFGDTREHLKLTTR